MEAATQPESPGAGKEERRQDPRLPVDEPASLFVVNQDSLLVCRIVEISLTGCRVRLGEPFVFAAPARVEAAFKLRGVAFRLAGVTRWSDSKGHVGVRFTDVTSRKMDELIELLCEVAAESASRAVRLAADRRAAEESRNASLKGQTGNAAPAPAALAGSPAHREAQVQRQVVPAMIEEDPSAHATQGDSGATGTLRAAKAVLPAPRPSDSSATLSEGTGAETPLAKSANRDRRSELRLKVETSAIILLVNVGSRLRGRILNLSIGGCRIRTEERFPVGIYTRVEIEFCLDGLPFRLGGVVQAIQDRHCVGIRFLDMSDRKRQQVEQLIMELAELRAGENLPACAPAPDPSPSA